MNSELPITQVKHVVQQQCFEYKESTEDDKALTRGHKEEEKDLGDRDHQFRARFSEHFSGFILSAGVLMVD